MHLKGTHLAQNAFGNIPRSLSCEADIQAVLTAFFGNQLKCIEILKVVLVSEGFAEEVMSFIENHDQWVPAERFTSGTLQEQSSYCIGNYFPSIKFIPD